MKILNDDPLLKAHWEFFEEFHPPKEFLLLQAIFDGFVSTKDLRKIVGSNNISAIVHRLRSHGEGILTVKKYIFHNDGKESVVNGYMCDPKVRDFVIRSYEEMEKHRTEKQI